MMFTKKDRKKLESIEFLLKGLMFAESTHADGYKCTGLSDQFEKLHEEIENLKIPVDKKKHKA